MTPQAKSAKGKSARILEHLLEQIDACTAFEQPFSHLYLESVFPPDLYEPLLANLPAPAFYTNAAERHKDGEAGYTRSMFPLTANQLVCLPRESQEMWAAVAEVLAAPALKEAVFAKLACDLAFRYGVTSNEVPKLEGYARPTLYRETEGFEIPPHPDTRKKIVTMHLYLPEDNSQVNLGTALYQRKLVAWPFGSWHGRFAKVKQFAFQPNSGYAFVVNNTLTKKSWHGREKLPTGAGVRNTLLNAFYAEPREEFVRWAA